MSSSSTPPRPFRFVLVGLAATLCYAVLAWTSTTRLGLPPPVASLASYAAAAVLSYLGHRHLTFRSRRPHGEAVPRFAGISVAGYGVAFLAPWLLTDRIGAHPGIAIAVTCAVVPVLTYVGLGRLVFRNP